MKIAPSITDQTLILPNDQFNEELINNVHPPQWKNPTPAGKYNLVIIGAGTAGLVTAAVASALGAKVALVNSCHEFINLNHIASLTPILHRRQSKIVQPFTVGQSF